MAWIAILTVAAMVVVGTAIVAIALMVFLLATLQGELFVAIGWAAQPETSIRIGGFWIGVLMFLIFVLLVVSSRWAFRDRKIFAL